MGLGWKLQSLETLETLVNNWTLEILEIFKVMGSGNSKEKIQRKTIKQFVGFFTRLETLLKFLGLKIYKKSNYMLNFQCKF
jgi:hypothetical protein